MSSSIGRVITRGLPMTAWVIIVYAILVFGDQLLFDDLFVERVLFTIPTLSAARLVVTGGWLIVILAFIALAVESVRATRVRETATNDYLSVLTLIVALILLIAVEQFGTTVFVTVFIAALIDVLQDRIIGQAVARRDWGVQVAPPTQ
jgi:hypothetical protein